MPQYGRLRLLRLLQFELSLMLILPFYTYYIAVTKDHIKPFPHSTITKTACPYPQDIVFRFGMLTASSFLALIFFCMFRWINYLKTKSQWPGTVPSFIYAYSELIILPYAVVIGTIDSGKTGLPHKIGSAIFFLSLFLIVVYLTFCIKRIRDWDSSVISSSGWMVKKVTCIYLLLVWAYCITNMVLDLKDMKEFLVILEWNTHSGIMLWLISFYKQWKDVYLSFNSHEKGPKLLETII